ncbi:hypothetical protein AB3N04_00995 (plasmid) [Alkalihalophilus sp. As8PL]|uniref:Uncharacterized protein n=1 Tax=Alkalihalophilus sp. As8PL TaxID=3237103 RepID=A0AB39BN17_9BACI
MVLNDEEKKVKLFKKEPRYFISRTLRLINDDSLMEVRGILVKEELYNPKKKEKHYESEYILVDIENINLNEVSKEIIQHIEKHPSNTFYKEVEITGGQKDIYLKQEYLLFSKESDEVLYVNDPEGSVATKLDQTNQ